MAGEGGTDGIRKRLSRDEDTAMGTQDNQTMQVTFELFYFPV